MRLLLHLSSPLLFCLLLLSTTAQGFVLFKSSSANASTRREKDLGPSSSSTTTTPTNCPWSPPSSSSNSINGNNRHNLLAMMAAGGGGSTTTTSSTTNTATTGGKSIFLLGPPTHRDAAAKAISKALNLPLHTATTSDTLLPQQGQTIINVDDKALTDQAGATFLAAQPLVINLVEADDFGGPLRQGASRFDVPVGGDVHQQEVLDSILRLAKLSGGHGDGKTDPLLDLDLGPNTFFLSLTFPDVRECLDILPGLEKGVDALELRVDLLRDTSPWAVLRQVAILKKHSDLPIIFTVRSKDQCGAFPDDPEGIFKLLALGLRAGVEVLDVEACWERPIRDALLEEAWRGYRGTTRLLGSYHVVGKPTADEDALRIFKECYHEGKVDAVKVVLTAMSVQDSYRVHELAAATKLPCPIVALCLGEVGKLSRVLNPRYTPVTSKLLPFIAAPGQLTAEEIMRLRQELGMVPASSFCLLGHPISKSPSPAMHNAAFGHTLLPHTYTLFETEDVETFRDKVRSADFGGASVTIPHKQNIIPLLDHIDQSAQAVGAVNTIVVNKDPHTGTTTLTGHNTDYKGIVGPISRRLSQTGRGTHNPHTHTPRVALVVGGGGTALAAAYAMSSLGLKLLVFNRTPSKAQEVAERFGGRVLLELTPEAIYEATGGKGGGGQEYIDVVVSTIPAAAEFVLPAFLLKEKPVVMDVAYRPAETSLLAQARQEGCPFVQGAEMLIGQGMEQFQLWTKRRAPEEVMRRAVYATVEELK